MNLVASFLPSCAALGLVLPSIWGHPVLAAGNEKALARVQAGKAMTFHVATDGSDGWSGLLARPNRQRTDGPWATLAHARDEIRVLRQAVPRGAAPAVTVVLQGGRYELAEALVLTPEDSGRETAPLRWVAARGERPVVSGGRRITQWRPASVRGQALWVAELPEVREGRWYFRQLWVDGQRRVRARHPNQGYLAVAEVPDKEGDWTKGQARFQFKAGDLEGWATAASAEVVVMNRWVESRLPITGIQEGERLVTFGKRSVFKLEAGDLYYVEGAFELLDRAGEWYLDRGEGVLYYWPLPGEDPRASVVMAPVLPQLVRLAGEVEQGHFVEHIEFEGITFSHTEWYYPDGFTTGASSVQVHPAPSPEVGGFAQAAVGVPGAVRGDGVRFCRFEGCAFTQVGGYGLELVRGCRHNRITRCELSDLGGGGIKLGETVLRDHAVELTAQNTVMDCEVRDGGKMFHSAIGIWVGQSPGNVIAHCHLRDFFYTGISIGWTWGYGRAQATNNTVEWNYIHHIGRKADGDGPILSDMAGIYTLGLQTGTVIRNNLWHDMAATRYGGWGIYFDEGTTGILAENNVVYRTTHGGFHQHYGKENTIRNNIFAFARDHQVQRSRVEPHRTINFLGNIVFWDNASPLFGGDVSDQQFAFDRNVYWRTTGGELRFGKRTWEEWRGIGMDLSSVIADPQFVDPAQGDFTLRSTSPALALGFEPIDLRGVGVRPVGGK